MRDLMLSRFTDQDQHDFGEQIVQALDFILVCATSWVSQVLKIARLVLLLHHLFV